MAFKFFVLGLFGGLFGVSLGGCTTTTQRVDPAQPKTVILDGIPGVPKPALALVPQARTYTGEIPPVIKDILPNSVAENFKFKLGDQIIKLNNEVILSAAQFDQKIKHAPQESTIVYKRSGRLYSNKVVLGMERPRFGAGFEPEGVALIKRISPFVSFMHQKELTVFAETSINQEQDTLHINAILKSNKPLTATKIKYSVYDRGTKTYLGNGEETLNATSPDSRVFKKAFHKGRVFKGPISVALAVEGKRFHFEFQ